MPYLKLKSRLIGWLMVVFVIIMGILCSCENEMNPCLEGVFVNDGIELVFNDGNLSGKTECNTITGNYFISGCYIEIELRKTKVYCINEYKTVYLRDVNKYCLEDNTLILSGNDFEIMFYNIK